MKILHFILGRVSPDTSNGVNKVIAGLAKYSSKQGHQVHIIGWSKSQTESFCVIERDGFSVESYRDFFNGAFSRLKELSSAVDIVHLHSVWNHHNLIIAAYLRKHDIPYVITAHSGLTEDRLKQSRYWFKILYHKLFQKYFFDGAIGVHALTREESTVLRKHTKNTNIFVVHNGQDMDGVILRPKSYLKPDGLVNIGFVGRLSVEKNIDGLITALSLLPIDIKSKLRLHLVGPNAIGQKKIKRYIYDAGVADLISLDGPLYGDAKENVISNWDFYIHPAHSDVVSIAVMEAMKFGLPSIITRTSDMSYFYNSGAFVMVEPDPKDIARGIVEMFEKRADWPLMSVNAIQLVDGIFNWDSCARNLITEYTKCLRAKID
ncbi:MAG: glycosyltransferase [Cocleimonas sp.]